MVKKRKAYRSIFKKAGIADKVIGQHTNDIRTGGFNAKQLNLQPTKDTHHHDC
jgi:hypothetical protein